MITGSHSIVYSADANADIAFFKDVLKFPNVTDIILPGGGKVGVYEPRHARP